MEPFPPMGNKFVKVAAGVAYNKPRGYIMVWSNTGMVVFEQVRLLQASAKGHEVTLHLWDAGAGVGTRDFKIQAGADTTPSIIITALVDIMMGSTL